MDELERRVREARALQEAEERAAALIAEHERQFREARDRQEAEIAKARAETEARIAAGQARAQEEEAAARREAEDAVRRAEAAVHAAAEEERRKVEAELRAKGVADPAAAAVRLLQELAFDLAAEVPPAEAELERQAAELAAREVRAAGDRDARTNLVLERMGIESRLAVLRWKRRQAMLRERIARA